MHIILCELQLESTLKDTFVRYGIPSKNSSILKAELFAV